MNRDKGFNLRLVSLSFDSQFTDILIELNHLRKLKLQGSTAPWMFFQLKNIFHILESVGSARIEGNRTTISEYIERKIEHQERSSERFSEIANVEAAMDFIEENIGEGTKITHHFIRELHHLVVGELTDEGDKTPGAYRTWNVEILKSTHIPPDHIQVQFHMDEFLSFINEKAPDKYDLLKTAIAHHRFTWIHPFGNGNGRVVRLLTYALLIKYGFNVKDGKILNPTAVFCNDRDLYYEKLSEADLGDDPSLLNWCDYVLTGILEEVKKVSKLLDFGYLYQKILVPTINLGIERGYLNSSFGERKFYSTNQPVTVQQDRPFDRILDDIDKCLDESKTGIKIDQIKEIIICYLGKLTTAHLTSALGASERLPQSLKAEAADRNVRVYY